MSFSLFTCKVGIMIPILASYFENYKRTKWALITQLLFFFPTGESESKPDIQNATVGCFCKGKRLGRILQKAENWLGRLSCGAASGFQLERHQTGLLNNYFLYKEINLILSVGGAIEERGSFQDTWKCTLRLLRGEDTCQRSEA